MGILNIANLYVPQVITATPGTGNGDGIPITGVPGNLINWEPYINMPRVYSSSTTPSIVVATPPQPTGVAVTAETTRIVPGLVAPVYNNGLVQRTIQGTRNLANEFNNAVQNSIIANQSLYSEPLNTRVIRNQNPQIAVQSANMNRPGIPYGTQGTGAYTMMYAPDAVSENDVAYSMDIPEVVVVPQKTFDEELNANTYGKVSAGGSFKDAFNAARAAGALLFGWDADGDGRPDMYQTINKGESREAWMKQMEQIRKALAEDPKKAKELEAKYPGWTSRVGAYGSHPEYGSGRGNYKGNKVASKNLSNRKGSKTGDAEIKKGSTSKRNQTGKTDRYGKSSEKVKTSIRKNAVNITKLKNGKTTITSKKLFGGKLQLISRTKLFN